MTPPKSNGRRSSGHLILRQLGHGNLTRVFLAAAPAKPRGELVVLKHLHPELAKDDSFRALFLEQAATTLALRHPNLVRALEVVDEADTCGLTLEFLQGQTLARVLERVGRQRFPVDLHLHIVGKVLEALEHAQEFASPGYPDPGFMHRDVCPGNVFITYDGQVKLLGTGFGSAVRALETRLGRPLLDVKYAAPEVLLGFPSGPSADVFAVGVLVWEAVTRQARVSSDDPRAVVRRRTSGEEPALERVWPDAAEPLIALCARSLAMNPGDRYATARAFRADLEAYLRRAAETSDAVLGRLPELMEGWFGREREQMQMFIRARLDAVDSGAPAMSSNDEPGDELAVDDEWSTLTRTADSRTSSPSTRIINTAGANAARPSSTAPPADRDVLVGSAAEGFRTGLRRARPEPLLPLETAPFDTVLREVVSPAALSPAALSSTALSPAALSPTALPRPAAHDAFVPRHAVPRQAVPRQAVPRLAVPDAPASHESARRETGVREQELRSSEAETQPPPSRRPSLAERLFDAPNPARVVGAAEVAERPLPSAPEPPPQETSTAENRAYSSNLGSVWPRRASRLSPDVLGAAALLVGSLVAAYSVYRHTQRDKQPESAELAIHGEARAAAPPPATGPGSPLPAPEQSAAADGSSEQGAEAGGWRVPAPAFFDGHAASSGTPGAPPSLRADELPAVDPALRSLQDAIVLSAKGHRNSAEQRRTKKVAAASQAPPPAPRRTHDAGSAPGQR